MAQRLVRAATSNAFSTTLNGAIDSAVTTITLTSVTGLQATGIICIDRQDGSGNDTASKREYISYTGISGNDLTGVTRGVAGSTAQSHSSGAIAEENFSVTHWNDLYDFLTNEHTLTGLHVMAAPTIANARMITSMNFSGASLLGTIPRAVVWRLSGAFSGATTFLMPPIMIPDGANWQWFSLVTRTVASAVSAIVDINKNGTSIFSAVGRPMIAAAGTFVSTASIATKAIAGGDKFTIDYDGTGGLITDILIEGYYTP